MSQRVERTWIRTGGYRRLQGDWVKESVKDWKLDKRSMHFFAFGDDNDVIV